MSFRTEWLLIYSGVTLSLIAAALGMYIFGLRALKSRPEDKVLIKNYLEHNHLNAINIRRISSFSRLWLGGIFELSNLCRIYAVDIERTNEAGTRLYFSFDYIGGAIKVRRGHRWRDV